MGHLEMRPFFKFGSADERDAGEEPCAGVGPVALKMPAPAADSGDVERAPPEQSDIAHARMLIDILRYDRKVNACS